MFYVFTNVGSPGRTGHDYDNRWEGSRLRWYGKTGSRRSQPQIQLMLNPGVPVHVFWRSDNSLPFRYAGLAVPLEVNDTTPVEVLWAFTQEEPRAEYRDPDEVPKENIAKGQCDR